MSDGSSFVRQSLTDTVSRPPSLRTLTSSSRLAQRVPVATPRHSTLVNSSASGSATATSTPAFARQSSSGSIASLSKANARRDAEEVCKVLGIPSSSSSSIHATAPSPAAAVTPASSETPRFVDRSNSDRLTSLEERVVHKESEVAALKKQNALLKRKVDDLTLANERLETEKAAGGVGASGSKRLEELERQFEAQEQLLSGYQREAEKSLVQTERLQSQNKKMAELLARLHGPSWESDLTLDVPVGKRNRTSMTIRPLFSTPEAAVEVTTPEPPPEANQDTIDTVNRQVESIQLLLRAMDSRLVSRSAELEQLRSLALTEAAQSKERLEQLATYQG